MLEAVSDNVEESAQTMDFDLLGPFFFKNCKFKYYFGNTCF